MSLGPARRDDSLLSLFPRLSLVTPAGSTCPGSNSGRGFTGRALIALQPFLPGGDFASWFVDLIRRYDFIGNPRLLYPFTSGRLSLLNGRYPLLHSPGVDISDLACNSPVVVDSSDDIGMRLVRHPDIVVKIVSLPVGVVVAYHRIVHYRCAAIVVDDGCVVDVGDPDPAVIVYAIEIALVDDDRIAEPSVAADIDIDGRKAASRHDHGAGSPVMVGIIRLGRGQGYPSYVHRGMNPGHSSRVPAGAIVINGHAHGHLDPGCGGSPVPASATVHAYPVAVMVGHVPERFLGNPGVILVPFRPSAPGERGPVIVHGGWTPQGPLLAFVINGFPTSVLVQVIGIVSQVRRQIAGGIALYGDPLGPCFFPGGVPVVPRGVDGSGALFHRLAVRQQGTRTGRNLILGRVFIQDEIDGAGYRDDFHRHISHIQIERGPGGGHHVSERGCDFDQGVPALVVEPRNSGSHVDFGNVLPKGDELNLSVRADSYPGPVRDNELRLAVLDGVEGVVKPERRILDRGDPVFFGRHITEQLSFDEGYAPHHDRLAG